MTETRKVYTNPKPGTPLITTIISGCKTPALEVKFSNLVNFYCYNNSPNVPRYSVTCLIDPNEHKELLNTIHTIEKAEKVETILKNEHMKQGDTLVNTGKVLVKFQSREKIPVFSADEIENETPWPYTLEDELGKGEKVIVIFDILRYTKKNTMKHQHGISFKPSRIYLLPKDKS